MKGRGIVVLSVLGLLAVAAFIVGCGSGGNSSTAAETKAATSATDSGSAASSGPLSKEEFVKQANQICRDGLKEKDNNVTAAAKTFQPNSSSKASNEAVGKLVTVAVLPVYSEIIDQLDELSPPKADKATTDLIVQKYESAMQAAEANPASAIDSNPFQAGDKAAEAYGVTECIL